MLFQNKNKNKIRLTNSFGKVNEESFDFALIAKYFRHKKHDNAFHKISDKACNDLDFEELYTFVNRTSSKIGEQYLYNRLRVVPNKAKNFELDEKLIERFTKDLDFRIESQLVLEKLNRSEAYYVCTLFGEEHVKPPKWFNIIRLLSLGSLASLLMIFFQQQYAFLLLLFFIINTGIHYWNKKNLHQYMGTIPELLKLNAVASYFHQDKQLRDINPDLQKSINIVNKLRNRMSFFNLEAKLQGDLESIFWALMELFKITFLLEPILLFGVLKRIDTKRKEIEDIFTFVGHIDSLVSIASLRKGLRNYCLPIIGNTNELDCDAIYHPLIHNCVTNNIKLNGKSVLLTGSNMSGKTSFIRTLGLNIITGLTINTCFAKKAIIPKVKIYSAIRISDDLLNSKSYYFEEVLTIKDMLKASDANELNLFLLDEIFKGTNTVERISAGKAVLSHLAKKGNIVFVSTHDIELTDLLAKEYELYHFSELVENNTVNFDYKLKNGKLKNRNALRILQLNNYPKSLVDEAMEISQQLDQVINTSKQL